MSDTPLAAAVRAAAQRLADAGVPDPLIDAELLTGHLLSRRRGEVQAGIIRGDGIDAEQAAALDTLVAGRGPREGGGRRD